MRELVPPTAKGGVVKKNKHEFQKHSLPSFYKTREFRKKIAKIYYPIVHSYTYDNPGKDPIFKLNKDYKPPDTAMS